LPRLEHLYRELKAQGFVLAAVNIEEPKDVVRKWVQKEGVTYPVLLDHDGKVTIAYRVYGTPTVFLINRAGQLVGYSVGPRAWTGEKGRALLSALLSESGR
jgi:peroxiredoxin